MSSTVALTGVTGFIGRTLARRLGAENHRVRGLLRITSNATNLPTDLERVSGSMEDEASLALLLRGADFIIHCAAVVRGARENTFHFVNAEGTQRLARLAAQQRPVPRMLLISSLAAQQPELSPYAASKRGAENALAAELDLPWTVFRPPAVYGPGDRELLPLFECMRRGIAPAWGPPGARFSLLYVEDLASAVIKWMASERGERTIFELDDGAPQGYTLDDVIKIASQLRDGPVRRLQIPALALDLLANVNFRAGRAFGYAPMLTPWKLNELRYPRWVCDNNNLSSATGWIPQVKLAQGMQLTLDARST